MSAQKPQLALGDRVADFVLTAITELKDINCCAYLFRHVPSESQLMWLACDDTNRAFSIAFKTPPKDDTGVFHILEHSVLDGSRHYPVKEPFVDLLKSSMQTFLNALTFSDKTMYPVASTNVRDLENLISVYLDAVFFPRLMEDDYIFMQEGWRVELDDAQKPQLNGVVFNEMKGALSDPSDMLACELKRGLFPNTAYGFESGGNPEAIPALTLEDFRDTHARHYTLANARAVLYGKLDIARELEFLSEKYTQVWAEQTADNATRTPNPLELQAPHAGTLSTCEMAISPENSAAGAAYVIGTWRDRERLIATHILLDALMGSNEAPLKQKLLAANLGDDVNAYVFDGIMQPFCVFEVKGAHKDTAARLPQVIAESAAALATEGLDATRLEAAIAQLEFALRERDFGYPEGVAYAIDAMSGWLYSDGSPEDATSHLEFSHILRDLKASMGLGIFEDLLRSLFVDNAHTALAEVVPQTGTQASQTSSQARTTSAPSPAELALQNAAKTPTDQIVRAQEALTKHQLTPNTPEEKASIPRLGLQDVGEGPKTPTASESKHAPLPARFYQTETHGIAYTTLYFDLMRLHKEELPYVGMLAALLGKLDTRHHTALELDTLVNAHLGSLSFSIEVYPSKDAPLTNFSPKFVVEAAALDSEIDALAQIPAEICLETIFDDTERVQNILVQQKVALEETFVTGGHQVALSQVRASLLQGASAKDLMAGVSYYRFLRDNLANWEARKYGLCEVLRNLSARIFKANGVEVTFCGNEEAERAFWASAGDMGLGTSHMQAPTNLEVACLDVNNLGLIIPGDVSYVARAAHVEAPFSAAWLVANRALTYSYLWQEVRVQGGAYGAGFASAATGVASFYSFRDPAVAPTLARYQEAPAWLSAWDPKDSELESYVVTCLAGLDAPSKPRALVRKLDALYFSGRSATWEQEVRAQLFKTTLADVHAFGKELGRAFKACHTCVVGPRELLASAGAGTGADLKLEELM